MTTLKEFQKDIDTTLKEFISNQKNNKRFNDNCFGYNVFESPLIENADIWILGYNSKPQNNSNNLDFICSTLTKEKTDLADEKENLSVSFQSVFRYFVENEEILAKHTVFTNLHFFSFKDIQMTNYVLFGKNISPDDQNKYLEKVKIWNDFLYEFIKPKLILLLDWELYKYYFHYHKDFVNPKEIYSNNSHFYYTFKNTPTIQIKRTDTGIEDSKLLGEMIKDVLNLH